MSNIDTYNSLISFSIFAYNFCIIIVVVVIVVVVVIIIIIIIIIEYR
jgi:hypothetical protein